MKPEEFILNIVKAYKAARVPAARSAKIHRGRSRSISGIAEDLLAEYLVASDPSIDAVLVDQPMYSEKLQKQLCPDIVVVRDGRIDTLIDLKLDIGWHRDGLTELCEQHATTAKALQQSTCRLRDGVTKEVQHLSFTKDLSYDVVLISRTNINPDILQQHEEEIAALAPLTELFILCDTGHPNTYDLSPRKIVDTLSVNHDVFARLLQKI